MARGGRKTDRPVPVLYYYYYNDAKWLVGSFFTVLCLAAVTGSYRFSVVCMFHLSSVVSVVCFVLCALSFAFNCRLPLTYTAAIPAPGIDSSHCSEFLPSLWL